MPRLLITGGCQPALNICLRTMRGIRKRTIFRICQRFCNAHDLSMDSAAGSPEESRSGSLDNLTNRCLPHHVFAERNRRELLTASGMTVLGVEAVFPFHIFLLARTS